MEPYDFGLVILHDKSDTHLLVEHRRKGGDLVWIPIAELAPSSEITAASSLRSGGRLLVTRSQAERMGMFEPWDPGAPPAPAVEG